MYARIRPHTLVLAAALAAPLAFAQQQPQPAPGQSTPLHPTRGSIAAPLLSVEFAGGTLAQFVEAVKAASPEPVNVIVPGEVASLAVPPLSLKSVTPFMALQSLEFINNRGNVQAAQTGSIRTNGSVLRVAQLNLDNVANAPSGSAQTFAIAYDRAVPGLQPGMPGSPFGSGVTTRVFSVRELLAVDGTYGLTLDQIVQPIETALTVDNGDAPPDDMPKILVHKESNLVIVRGNARQAELAKQVLDRLREDVELSRERARPAQALQEAMKEVERQRISQDRAIARLLSKLDGEAKEQAARLESLQSDKPAEKELIERARKALEDAQSYRKLVERDYERAAAETADMETAARKLLDERTQAGSVAKEARQLREQIEELRRQIQDLKSMQGR